MYFKIQTFYDPLSKVIDMNFENIARDNNLRCKWPIASSNCNCKLFLRFGNKGSKLHS